MRAKSRIRWAVVVAWLLVLGSWLPAQAATTRPGMYGSPDCDITNPVAWKTFCRRETDGAILVWNGSAYIGVPLMGQLPASTRAGLPAAGQAGRLRRVTDDVGGIWEDTGSRWRSINWQIIDPTDGSFGCAFDGTTDDTGCWNTIFGLAGGGRSIAVALPPGTSVTTNGVKYEPNQQAGSLRLFCTTGAIGSGTGACKLKYGAAGTLGGTVFEASGAVRLVIEDLFLDASSRAKVGFQVHFDATHGSGAHEITLLRPTVGNITGSDCRGIEIGSAATPTSQASEVDIYHPFLQGDGATTSCKGIYSWGSGNVGDVNVFGGQIAHWGTGADLNGMGYSNVIGVFFGGQLVSDLAGAAGGAGTLNVIGNMSEAAGVDSTGATFYSGGTQGNAGGAILLGNFWEGITGSDDCAVKAQGNISLEGNILRNLRTATSEPKICAGNVNRGPLNTTSASVRSRQNWYKNSAGRAPIYGDIAGVNNAWIDYGAIPLRVSSWGDQGGPSGDIFNLQNGDLDLAWFAHAEVPSLTPGSIFGGSVVQLAAPSDLAGAGKATFVFISGAANNGSGLIRLTTSSLHGFLTGQSVVVEAVEGTIEANGTWTVTRIDATHIDLQSSTYVHAYTRWGRATNNGAVTGTNTGYKITALDYTGETDLSSEVVVSGPANLSPTGLIRLRWTPVGGRYVRIYRTSTSATCGGAACDVNKYITTLPAGADRYEDTGGAGTGYVPTANTTGGFSIGGGTVTRNLSWQATASVADGGTIAHGMGTTPTGCLTVGSVPGNIVTNTADATNITVGIKTWASGSLTAGSSQTIKWICLQ